MRRCRDTPDWSISTFPTMSLTECSPPRRISTMRSRVGSPRVWSASTCITVHMYHSAYVVARLNRRVKGGILRWGTALATEQRGSLLRSDQLHPHSRTMLYVCCSGRPLGLCGHWLPELNLIPLRVIDPGKATVGFIHSFGVNLYALLF